MHGVRKEVRILTGSPRIVAQAFANPDFTRSPIGDLSNWATAPTSWSSNSPLGMLVSTASVTETESIPSALHVSSPNVSCFSERDGPREKQTTTS